MHIIYILCFIVSILAKDSPQLFAGAGLTTYIYTLNHGVLEMNCTTYDDCYDLLSTPAWPEDYQQIIKPNDWSGNCSELDNGDDRMLNATLITTAGYKFYKWYDIYNLSGASSLLCTLNKKINITKIYYYYFP